MRIKSFLTFINESENKLFKTYNFSNSFKDLLNSLNDDISIKLLSINSDSGNLVDIVNDKLISINGQQIKVGRGINKILTDNNVIMPAHILEQWVNNYKRILSVKTVNVEIIEGLNILKYYRVNAFWNPSEYIAKNCMAGKSESIFELYTSNPNKVKLAVITSPVNPELIVARALLWYTDEGDLFLDRIYAINDDYVIQFKKWADANEIWHKDKQESSYRVREDGIYNFKVVNKANSKMATYTVTINEDPTMYPYLDSLCYYNSETCQLSNDAHEINADYLLCNTNGGWKPAYFEW